MINEDTDIAPEVKKDDPGVLGMWILIASLTMIFGASLIGYLIIRGAHSGLQEQSLQGMLGGLWLSTFVLLGSSVTMHWALSSIRGGKTEALKNWLIVTSVLGVLFLVLQGYNWMRILAIQPTTATELVRVQAEVNLARLAFFMLAGLHAVHVIGGIIPLGIITRNAFGGVYTAEFHPGVRYITMYWHFLDLVWIILFTVLFLFA